jgi:RNA polymerase sigma-70 factor, ECF subfamily
LARRPGFGSSDRDDIEQELALDLIVRLRNYDPAKARRTTFMARIVEHRIATLIEERNAACRDWRLRADAGDRDSFDSDGLGDAESALDLIPDPACDSAEDIALRIDLESALDELPEDLRGLWDLLLESSIPQISKQTGIPILQSPDWKRQHQEWAALRNGINCISMRDADDRQTPLR